MIVQGGIWDQPAGEWLAQQYAGYIAFLIDKEANAPFGGATLTDQELKGLLKIKKIRMEIASATG